MNPRRQEKCISWADWDGKEAVRKQWMFGNPFFIREGEARAEAKQQAQQRANDYSRTFDTTILPEEYPEWERVYCKAYINSYLATIPDYQQCRYCGKDDLPTNQDTHLCVRCLIDNKVPQRR